MQPIIMREALTTRCAPPKRGACMWLTLRRGYTAQLAAMPQFFLTLTLFGAVLAMVSDYQWLSDFMEAILGDPPLIFVNLRHVYPSQA